MKKTNCLICLIFILGLIFYDMAISRNYRNPKQLGLFHICKSKRRLDYYSKLQNWSPTYSKEGLENLNFHASACINLIHFNSLLRSKQKPVAIICGIPEVSYCRHMALKYFLLDAPKKQSKKTPYQKVLLSFLRRCFLNNALFPCKDYLKEEEIFQRKGIPILSIRDPLWLSTYSAIDQIVAFFDEYQSKGWLYIHCEHGKARTSTICCMLDMYLNANKVSLRDIMLRQYCFGGENFLDCKKWDKKNTWAEDELILRRNLIVFFYSYMKHSYPSKKFSAWMNENGFVKDTLDLHELCQTLNISI